MAATACTHPFASALSICLLPASSTLLLLLLLLLLLRHHPHCRLLLLLLQDHRPCRLLLRRQPQQQPAACSGHGIPACNCVLLPAAATACSGHGAFSDSKLLNSVVGHLTHAFIMVPYHGWRISHRTHHANHGHLGNDESWYPMTQSQYKQMGILARLGRLEFPFPLLAYPFYLWFRSPPKTGSHYDPNSSLFQPEERTMVGGGGRCRGRPGGAGAGIGLGVQVQG